ncbi:hypothetical protein NEHOM01_1452 [Nematocida homosporus]|uniref:uncharacterized protein n=1 Tax=Nematocida homosporus TaxID=1912981 RepID=UPI00221E86F1|nr:uncharacterized protein NEHOM01_1452 [Nematocida homosporus]KAI5186419.1 hypothetical protein NEHOM01_1452 [Nematocida homosporus]
MDRSARNKVVSEVFSMLRSKNECSDKEEEKYSTLASEACREAVDTFSLVDDSSYDKPAYSYATLITQAIIDSSERKLTLREIYAWIMNKYPYFRRQRGGWQNSIRHNLSLNKCFYKIPRAHNDPGKGSYWTVDSEYLNVFNPNTKSRRPAESAFREADAGFKKFSDSKSSFSEMLNTEKNFFDSIGVSDKHMFSKSFDSSIFDGNLRDINDDSFEKILTQNEDSIHGGTSQFFKFTK